MEDGKKDKVELGWGMSEKGRKDRNEVETVGRRRFLEEAAKRSRPDARIPQPRQSEVIEVGFDGQKAEDLYQFYVERDGTERIEVLNEKNTTELYASGIKIRPVRNLDKSKKIILDADNLL